ncbi:hypothetical protein ACFL6C_11790 [Myxococcota bacterium]
MYTWSRIESYVPYGVGNVLISELQQSVSAVVAHELFHYLAVPHTDEDLLDDTPSCNPHGMTPDQRELCPDAANIMFPYADGGIQITPQQRDLVLAFPAVLPGRCNTSAALSDPGACGPSCIDCTGLSGVEPTSATCVDGVCQVECAPGWEDMDLLWTTGCEN